MLEQSSYDRVKKYMYQISEGDSINTNDYFKIKNECPIGSKKTYYSYDNMQDIVDDTVNIKLDPRGAQERNPFNGLICCKTGVGKTRFLKRIIKYFHEMGWKILIIEPKSYEFINANKMGKGKRLHPYEKNTKLNIKALAPYFVRDDIPLELQGKYSYYVHKLHAFRSREDWMSLGLTEKGADFVVSQIRAGRNNLVQIASDADKISEMSPQARNAIINTISNLVGLDFFSSKVPAIDLEKYWKDDKIIVINYMTVDGKFTNTDVGKIMSAVKDIGVQESKHGLNNVTKKLVVVDDSYIVFNRDSQAQNSFNLAVKNMVNCQNNWRTYGVDTIIITQLPTSQYIPYNILNSCDHHFISFTNNAMSFRNKIPLDAFKILIGDHEYRPLYHDEKNYVFEWIYCHGVTYFERFYPFDVMVGHG